MKGAKTAAAAAGSSTESVKVAVRCRPMNKKEKDQSKRAI